MKSSALQIQTELAFNLNWKISNLNLAESSAIELTNPECAFELKEGLAAEPLDSEQQLNP